MACGFQATLPARRSVKACGSMADALHAEAANAWIAAGNHDLRSARALLELMVLSFTGRKSGKQYAVPVGYLQKDNRQAR